MATYAIGDVQGCWSSLAALLGECGYRSGADRLWFAGDLINRGPDSLSVLRFVANEPGAIAVLGNHDLHVLALWRGVRDPDRTAAATLAQILAAPEGDALLGWLEQRPLLHHDTALDCVLVHAGILPAWSLMEAACYAREVEAELAPGRAERLYRHMYGNEPAAWSPLLEGYARLRFIINTFTRMRYCVDAVTPDYSAKGAPGTQPAYLQPWFQVAETAGIRTCVRSRIAFGHWSLLGHRQEGRVIALDSGCLWGRALTAVRLEDGQPYRVDCPAYSDVAPA